jgi:hypothetical protein
VRFEHCKELPKLSITREGGISSSLRPVEAGELEGKVCARFMWPVVRYESGTEMLMKPEMFEAVIGATAPVARVVKVPLILGYGLTVCKAQGLTLEKAILVVDGRGHPGMVYTALSRVRKEEDLIIHMAKHVEWKSVVRAEERAVQWLQRVYVSPGWLRLEQADCVGISPID